MPYIEVRVGSGVVMQNVVFQGKCVVSVILVVWCTDPSSNTYQAHLRVLCKSYVFCHTYPEGAE